MNTDQRLFSIRDRSDPAPRRGNETSFEFLDRVAWPFWNRLRSMLDEWFGEYPAEHAADLRQRFRGRDDEHGAAWWELYLYRILSRTGRRVTPHPTVPGTSRRPDFVVEEPDGNVWYVEATTSASGDPAAERRIGAIVTALEAIDSPNFFVCVSWRRVGAASLPLRVFRARVADWLNSLDPNEISARTDADVGGLPTIRWEHDDWVILLRAMPKSPALRGKRSRTVGMQNSAFWRGDHDHRLLRSLDEKARSYGDLASPYVIACRTTDPLAEIDGCLHDTPDDAVELRGGETLTRRVSALVIAGPDFQPWSVCEVTPVVAMNVMATHALRASVPWPIVRTKSELGDAERSPLPTIEGILGVPADFRTLKKRPFPRDSAE